MIYDHLLSLSTTEGLFEHCTGDQPLPEHGYCVDDVARALIVIARDGDPPATVDQLADTCMDFLSHAQHRDGSLMNRRSTLGTWDEEHTVADHWGRALWAWGTVIGHDHDRTRVENACQAFELSASRTSPHLRSMAFAALGAAEVLDRYPASPMARSLLQRAHDRIPCPPDSVWPWPEARLTYANATIPHVLILAGHHLGDADTLERGLELLDWLIGLQTQDDHLSVIGSHGWGPADTLPGFDQQPIEVAHLVDACITAYDVHGDPAWLDIARRGALWFYGVNDVGVWMHDPKTGAGYDGLTPEGRNDNRGAESTLAHLSVMGQLQKVGEVLEVRTA